MLDFAMSAFVRLLLVACPGAIATALLPTRDAGQGGLVGDRHRIRLGLLALHLCFAASALIARTLGRALGRLPAACSVKFYQSDHGGPHEPVVRLRRSYNGLILLYI